MMIIHKFILNFLRMGGNLMDREQLLIMDPYILLSLINMKLRDEFISLDDLCDNYEIESKDIKDKLKSIEYKYNELTNQFTSA